MSDDIQDRLAELTWKLRDLGVDGDISITPGYRIYKGNVWFDWTVFVTIKGARTQLHALPTWDAVLARVQALMEYDHIYSGG